MQSCKYPNFEIRFFSQNEEIAFKKKYDFALFEDGIFEREIIFGRSKNQLVFEANKHMQMLGNCEKYIIVENGVQLIFLWTSLRGAPEKINMRGGKKQLMDYLFLTFTKKKNSCLYIGDSFEAPMAGWRNELSVDVIYQNPKIIDQFLKNTVEQFLPF